MLMINSIFAKGMENRKLKNSELIRLDAESYQKANKTNLIVVLDNIRSLNNIGSVFRTSDAFLIKKIYLCGITAKPPHKDIHKTALGATENVEWEYVEDVMEVVHKLQKDKIFVAAVEQAENAVFLDEFTLNPEHTYAVVFGNEVKGVQQKVVSASDAVIEIPQFGVKHSLNIAVCAGVVLWSLFAQMKQTTNA